jgi:antitoxin component of MazEF toxin-antitoxin module
MINVLMASVKSKIVQIGNSIGIAPPKGLDENSNLDKRDEVTISYADGLITISPFDDQVQQDLELARGITKQYRNTLRELSR